MFDIGCSFDLIVNTFEYRRVIKAIGSIECARESTLYIQITKSIRSSVKSEVHEGPMTTKPKRSVSQLSMRKQFLGKKPKQSTVESRYTNPRVMI